MVGDFSNAERGHKTGAEHVVLLCGGDRGVSHRPSQAVDANRSLYCYRECSNQRIAVKPMTTGKLALFVRSE